MSTLLGNHRFQETGGKFTVANGGVCPDSLGGGPVEKSCKADQS